MQQAWYFLASTKRQKKCSKYYNFPFRPGQMIFDGFIDDFEVFDEKGVVPKQHLEKVEKIKLKLNSWNIKKN